MVAGCGMTCIKYILFVVNFLFFAVGCAAVGLGVYALVDKDNLEALTKIDSDGSLDDFNARGLLQNGAIVLVVGGAVLVVLGFLGCCGAVKEVKCMLAVYAGIVVLIIIVQITAAALAIAFKGRAEDYLQQGLLKGLQEYYNGNLTSGQPFSVAFDLAQVEWECCGVNSSSNFEDLNTPWWQNKPAAFKVPPTCCKLKNKDKVLSDLATPELENPACPVTAPGPNNPNTDKPCYESIKDWVVGRAVIIIGIAFGIVFVEFIAVVFACCLYRSIDE